MYYHFLRFKEALKNTFKLLHLKGSFQWISDMKLERCLAEVILVQEMTFGATV